MNTELFITTPRAGTVTVDGTTALVGAGTDFTASDVGKPIIIRTTAGDKRGVIATYTSATSVTVATAIDISQSGCFFYIDYQSVDISDDIPFPLTYKIADVREPDKRDSSRSLTLNIPGTKANNIIFDHIYEIDAEGSFNPNIRAFVVIYENYFQIFSGNLQLLKINRDGDKIEYECAVFGKIGDLFQKVADKLLTDLDLSDLNETGTATDITNSWAGGGDLFYPLLNNGRQAMNIASPAFISDQIAPAIRWSTIFERILSSVGYSNPASATLYSETGMDKLYVPCLKDWRRRAQVEVSIRGQRHLGATQNTLIYLRIERVRQGINEDILIGGFGGTIVTHYYNSVIELDHGDVLYPVLISDATGSVDIYKNNGGNLATFFKVTYLDLNFPYNYPGDIDVQINADTTPSVSTTPLIMQYNQENSDVYNMYSLITHKCNTPVKNTQGFLPDNYKQRDFLIDTIKMFNLYLEPVTDSESQITILPRDTFYNNLNVVDWTEKIDVGQNIELIPMGELDWKEYQFTWKQDGDFWNTDYNSKCNKIYGERTVIVENDFIATKKNVEVNVAPFPLLKTPYNDLVLPVCIKDGVATVPNQFAGNLRFIYFDADMESGAFTLDGVAQSTYPFSGHLVGTPQAPTFDYNWAAPLQLYYPMTDITVYPYSANLYTEFWQNYINEISDKYSKILIAYFRLTPEDVRDLDFSAKYFIDGTYFRLNKVIDYNPLGNQLTKCELIRINEAVYAAQVVSNGDTQVGTATDTEPPYTSSAVLPGGVIVGDANGYGVSQAISQDLTLDSSARATVTGFRGIALDTAVPTNGQVYVYNSGSSIWEPQTPSGGGGTPGGSNKQVQYNDSGSFGAEAGFEYDKTTNELTVPDLIDSALTASELIATDAGKKLQSLSVATYPSLTEIRNVKGVTSPIQTQLSTKEATANKDASGGYAGLTLFKINFKNVLNTFTSFFTNSNTAARTYTFQDRDGTIADDTDLALKAPIASPIFTGTVTTPAIVVSSETASTIASFDASKNIKSLALETYPSLTELAYVKGVTSAIQTQIDTKKTDSMTTARILGRTTAGTGAIEEISIGSGLSLTSGTLNTTTGTNIILNKTATDVTVNATAETKVYSYTVPANTLSSGDILDLIARFRKTGTAGTMITRIRFGTNNSTADTIMATMTSAASTLTQNMERTWVIKDATHIEVYPPTSNVNTDAASSGTAVTSVTVDLTVTNYIVITIQDASAVDTGIFSSFYVRKN